MFCFLLYYFSFYSSTTAVFFLGAAVAQLLPSRLYWSSVHPWTNRWAPYSLPRVASGRTFSRNCADDDVLWRPPWRRTWRDCSFLVTRFDQGRGCRFSISSLLFLRRAAESPGAAQVQRSDGAARSNTFYCRWSVTAHFYSPVQTEQKEAWIYQLRDFSHNSVCHTWTAAHRLAGDEALGPLLPRQPGEIKHNNRVWGR